MIWRHRKKRGKNDDMDAYVQREKAEAEAVHKDTRRQAAEARNLQAESARVHEQGKKTLQDNHFTSWVMQLLRGVQEDGR